MSIYRFRPSNENTINELENNFLWFSKPKGFNDSEDCCISGFIDSNISLEAGFKKLFGDCKELIEESKKVGICCFTTNKNVKFTNFPKGKDGILIEYNKKEMEEYFKKEFGLANCFNLVEYIEKPLESFCDSNGLIEWEIKGKDIFLCNINNIIRDPKKLDKLFLMMFTRINIKYKNQFEARIILGGRNVKKGNKYCKGYKIHLPKESINCIYVNDKTSEKIINKIKDLNYELKLYKD